VGFAVIMKLFIHNWSFSSSLSLPARVREGKVELVV